MKAVHFGAGNIGRGFIGLLLSQSGYEVCFVTRNQRKTALLRSKNKYHVMLANNNSDLLIVDNVTAINIDNTREVIDAVVNADVLTTAVGVSALKEIAEPIARGIEQRVKCHRQPLTVIACENALAASHQLKNWVYTYLDLDVQRLVDKSVAFLDTVVDRIVPSQSESNPLQVTVEPFYEWIVERTSAIGPLPKVNGIQYVDSLEPYVERKLFTVNTGHASAAYYGYLEGYETISEVMKNEQLRIEIESVLEETGRMLVQKYDLDEQEQQSYTRRILSRFSNQNLTDRVARVGRCPIRKLGSNERLVRPALLAYDMGLEITHLTSAIAAALLYNYPGDSQVVKLHKALEQQGIHEVIAKFMGIARAHPIHERIVSRHEKLKRMYYSQQHHLESAQFAVLSS